MAATRTYVQSGIYDKFVTKAAEIAKKRKVGNPYDDVDQGPQVSSTNVYVVTLRPYYYFTMRNTTKTL